MKRQKGIFSTEVCMVRGVYGDPKSKAETRFSNAVTHFHQKSQYKIDDLTSKFGKLALHF